MTNMTPKEWQSEFQSILCEGVDKNLNYVKLAEKTDDHAGYRLQFRPILSRIVKNGILVGGKLGVFFTEQKSQPINDETAITWLKSPWPKFNFTKEDSTRVGFNLVVPVPVQNALEFYKQFRDSYALVDGLLDFLEEEGGFAIGDNREIVRQAIKKAYDAMLVAQFEELSSLNQSGLLDEIVDGKIETTNVVPISFAPKTIQ